MSLILDFFIYSYLVGPNRGAPILLFQVTTRVMRLKRLCTIKRQDSGLFTKSDGEGITPQRIAG